MGNATAEKNIGDVDNVNEASSSALAVVMGERDA